MAKGYKLEQGETDKGQKQSKVCGCVDRMEIYIILYTYIFLYIPQSTYNMIFICMHIQKKKNEK